MFINLLKPTGHVMHQQFNIQQLLCSAHTVFMCFVIIWEQTVTSATYSINWLVFITEMKSVGFYNQDEKCLLRSMNWVFKWSSLHFVFKGLNWTTITGTLHEIYTPISVCILTLTEA